jgi:hypothetical protein
MGEVSPRFTIDGLLKSDLFPLWFRLSSFALLVKKRGKRFYCTLLQWPAVGAAGRKSEQKDSLWSGSGKKEISSGDFALFSGNKHNNNVTAVEHRQKKGNLVTRDQQ